MSEARSRRHLSACLVCKWLHCAVALHDEAGCRVSVPLSEVFGEAATPRLGFAVPVLLGILAQSTWIDCCPASGGVSHGAALKNMSPNKLAKVQTSSPLVLFIFLGEMSLLEHRLAVDTVSSTPVWRLVGMRSPWGRDWCIYVNLGMILQTSVSPALHSMLDIICSCLACQAEG